MCSLTRSFKAIFAILIFSALCFAQTETGQITGTVMDASGAAIPNATVEIKSADTGALRAVKTGGSGDYAVTNLLPGVYSVTATASGFNRTEQRVNVTVGARIGQDLRLEVGTSSAVVEVTESAVQVNTETQTLGQTITQKELRELPNLTRNPYQFVALAGNVSDAGMGTRGAGFSINGQRESSTNILLDGSSNNDEFNATVGQQIPLDAVAEFSVLTSNFTAEYGRASGGVVNVVTKSGTNTFHGTAYEFNRVSRFSSNSFQSNADSQPKSVFGRNQFGYSVGGPIVKDKLFFFNSTEWIRVRSGSNQFAWVPTPELLAATAAPTQGFFGQLGQLRSSASNLGTISRNGLIGATGSDPCDPGSACAALNPNLPLFQHVGYTAPADAGGGVPQNTYMTVGRVDYNLSDRTQMYGRYALYSESDFQGSLANSPYSNYDLGQTQFNNNALFSVIHSFSPALTSQSKVVFNRLTNIQQGLTSRGLVPTMYASLGNIPTIGADNILFPGYNPSTPGNGGAFGGPQNYIQAYEDVSWSRDKHSFRFGGSYDYIRDNRTYAAYQTAIDGLTDSGTIGDTLDALLAGTFSEIEVAVDPKGHYPCAGTPTPACEVTLPVSSPNFSRSNRFQEFALYAQDSWKVIPRFTVNLGLRWEYFGVQHNKNANLDSNWYGATTNQADTNLAAYIAQGSLQPAPKSPVGGLWKPDYHDFSPRVGFAWDVTGDGKTALRGGYGIGYERNYGNVTYNIIQNPPNYAVLDIDDQVSPITSNNFGPLAGSGGVLPLPRTGARIVDPNISTAYAHTWSGALEHQFGTKLFWSAEYSGSKGVNLYSISYPNLAGYGNLLLGYPCTGAGDCTKAPNSQYSSGIGFRGNQGFSLYNGLNNKLVIRNIGNAGIDMTVNYTWSHAIDNLSSTFFEAAGSAGIYGGNNVTINNGNFEYGLLDPYAPKLDKGSAEFDVRHRVVVAGSWKVPFGHGSGIFNALIGGWSLNPVFTARSGIPFSIFDSSAKLGSRTTARASFSQDAPTSSTGLVPTETPDSYDYLTFSPSQIISEVNPACDCNNVAPFPSNMSGRNAFRAPGFWNLDLGVNKDFKISERVSVQLRAETFNLFNHANLYVVGQSADVASSNSVQACYGCTASTYDHRNLQLGAKIIF